MQQRNVILYIAMSLDGYIAKENGDIDWLSIVDNPSEDYGYAEFVKGIDTVILGRKTYEKVLSFGIDFPHKDKKCYVLSRTKSGFDENVEYYSSDLASLIQDLKSRQGKNIFIDGGAEVVNALLRLDLIDECIISVLPILLGDGIRLFQGDRPTQRLTLKSSTQYTTGLVMLRYQRYNGE